jgi:uncharacterized phage protein (TIGR01671 family)
MHAIKYKVWCKVTKRFIQDDKDVENRKNHHLKCYALRFDGTLNFFESQEGGMMVEEKENVEIIFSTGLKDNIGREIYEGDVVGKEEVYHFIQRNGWQPETGNWKIIGEKTKNFTGKEEEKYIAGYELSVVEWKDKSCGFEPFSDSEKNCGHCSGGKDPIEIEVIGNIYENPELLEKTQNS